MEKLILIKVKEKNSEDIPVNWFIWERHEFYNDITPDVYTDIMDEIVENYNRTYTEFYFDWYVV
ncbi:MAG: hypothetical protein J6A06_08135 [Fibrobacteraceae bacterium]|nr:hypothetical protein [Fibrobacteraceae bacterium]